MIGWLFTLNTPATDDHGVPLPAEPGSRTLLKKTWANPRAGLIGPAANQRPVQCYHFVQPRHDPFQQRSQLVVGGQIAHPARRRQHDRRQSHRHVVQLEDGGESWAGRSPATPPRPPSDCSAAARPPVFCAAAVPARSTTRPEPPRPSPRTAPRFPPRRETVPSICPIAMMAWVNLYTISGRQECLPHRDYIFSTTLIPSNSSPF